MGNFGLCTAEFVGSQLETESAHGVVAHAGIASCLVGVQSALIAALWSHLALMLADPRSVLRLGLKPVSIPSIYDRQLPPAPVPHPCAGGRHGTAVSDQ